MEYDENELKRDAELADKIILFMQKPVDRLIKEMHAEGLDQDEISAGFLLAAFYALGQIDEPLRRLGVLNNLDRLCRRMVYHEMVGVLGEGKRTKTRVKSPRKDHTNESR